MSQPEPVASRRELDQLREDVRRLDEHGTRGIGVVQAQLTDVVKNLAEMKSEVNTRFEAHQRVHDRDEQARVSGRRWMIATTATMLGGLAGVLGLLVEILQHLH